MRSYATSPRRAWHPDRAELVKRNDPVLPQKRGQRRGIQEVFALRGNIPPKVEHPAGAPPLFAQFVHHAPQRGPTYRKYT